MSEAVWPIQFTVLGTGEKIVMTVRSNIVRVSPMYRVLVLRLISTNNRRRTTMNSSVGRRGMTSTGAAMAEEANLKGKPETRNLKPERQTRNQKPETRTAKARAESEAGRVASGFRFQVSGLPCCSHSIEIFLNRLKSVNI